jgi:hypothetical protein
LYEVPAAIQGKECLIEKGERDYTVYTIPVAPPRANLCTDSVTVRIEGGTVVGAGTATFRGERKANLLSSFSRFDSSLYRGIVSAELPKASNKFIVGKVDCSGIRETAKDFRLSYTFSMPDYLTAGSDRMYLNMNLDRFPGGLVVEEDRVMPVESEQTFDNVFSCTLIIPQGYRPEKIPEPAAFSYPEFGFSQQYSLKDDTLTLTSRVYFAFQIINGEKIKQFSQMLSALNRAYSKSMVLIKK